MTPPAIQKITIAGGGTAGWMVAASLAKALSNNAYEITLVESDEIGTVGVGEATVPMLQRFVKYLGVEESDFMRETNGTFKLGIEFCDWKRKGESYIHPFGQNGRPHNGVEFIHYWLRFVSMGGSSDLGQFNAETLAARHNKFAITDNRNPNLAPINYAYHFDASLFAAYLRKYSEHRGVIRREGKIIQVNQNSGTGNIESISLDNGQSIEGHLFIDCTGFKSLLLGKQLKVDFEDWTQWLPCNSALAAPTEHNPGDHLTPYTRATARDAGWQWKIPLQHRAGNGYVYSSAYCTDEQAQDTLLNNLDGKLLRDPKLIRFTTGHRYKIWEKNVIAVGLAGGFLEPLESTAIYLIQITIAKLLTHLPKAGFCDAAVKQFNREMISEYVQIRDFLVAHYTLTEREDTKFWQDRKEMEIPDSLKERLDMFSYAGTTNVRPHEFFQEHSWTSMLIGQGIMPTSYHPIADGMPEEDLRRFLMQIKLNINERLKMMPTQDVFFKNNSHYRSNDLKTN